MDVEKLAKAVIYCVGHERCTHCPALGECYEGTDEFETVKAVTKYYAEREKSIYEKLRAWLKEQETGGNIVIDPLEMYSKIAEWEEEE